MPSFRGFFGKLPARGDFVSAGLPREFVTPWDDWISGTLAAALAASGDGWLQAPVWRFALAPGLCGANPVAGVLLPSNDKVGRPFPMTLAWLADDIDAVSMADAERLGFVAIAEALPPAVLAERLANIAAGGKGQSPAPASGSLWWEGRGGIRSLRLPALPDVGTFMTMMARGTCDDR